MCLAESPRPPRLGRGPDKGLEVQIDRGNCLKAVDSNREYLVEIQDQ